MLERAVNGFLSDPRDYRAYARLVEALRQCAVLLDCPYAFSDPPPAISGMPSAMPESLENNLRMSAKAIQQALNDAEGKRMGMTSVVELAYLCTYHIRLPYKPLQ